MKKLLLLALITGLYSCGKGSSEANNTNANKQNVTARNVVDNDIKLFLKGSIPQDEQVIFACNERIEDHGGNVINKKFVYSYRDTTKRTWYTLGFGKKRRVEIIERLLKVNDQKYNNVYEISSNKVVEEAIVSQANFELIKGTSGIDGIQFKQDKGDEIVMKRLILPAYSQVSAEFSRVCTDNL